MRARADEPEAEEPELEADGAPSPRPSPTSRGARSRPMPSVSSPALDELAGRRGLDRLEAAVAGRRKRAPTPKKAPADEEITVKPVETVSPMDLVMDDAEDEPEKAGKAPRAARSHARRRRLSAPATPLL